MEKNNNLENSTSNDNKIISYYENETNLVRKIISNLNITLKYRKTQIIFKKEVDIKIQKNSK